MWRMNYLHVCETFLKTLLGCPFGGTCLQPVIKCFAFFQIEGWWDPRAWSALWKNYAQHRRLRQNSLPNEDFRLERLYHSEKSSLFFKFNLQTSLFKFYLQTALFKFYHKNCTLQILFSTSISALLSSDCLISSYQKLLKKSKIK